MRFKKHSQKVGFVDFVTFRVFHRGHVYICISNIDPISYIQYRIPIRDPPHPTTSSPRPPCRRPRHGVGWGEGESRMGINIGYRIFNICCIFFIFFFNFFCLIFCCTGYSIYTYTRRPLQGVDGGRRKTSKSSIPFKTPPQTARPCSPKQSGISPGRPAEPMHPSGQAGCCHI